MITSRNIANIGSPADDPTCPIPAILWIPDLIQYPGPHPCVVLTEAPGFSDDVGLQLPSRTAQSFAGVGLLALAFQCRVDGPLQSPPRAGIPGQTTDGGWHQQTDDCKIAIRYMRPLGGIETVQLFSVSGSVGAVGGSGSGHHALYCAVDGTALDDKADWAIGFSPPTDFGDRSAEVLARPQFVDKVVRYGRSSDTAILTSRSTIAGNLANASAIRQYNGTGESMPITQLTGFRDAMVLAGNTKYVSIIIDDPQYASRHSWGIWSAVPNVETDSNQWALEQVALFDGNPPPPPPPPPAPDSQVKVTAAATGMLPGTPMVLTVIPTDIVTGLDGPPESYSFITDPAGIIGGGGTAPAGNYALIDAVDGVPVGNLSTRAWWDFAYVDGGRLPTNWAALNPTGTSYTWAQVDAFLALCGTKAKPGGISIDCGVKSPAWIYSGPQGAQGVQVSDPNVGKMPLVWDRTYQKIIKNFITQLGTHVDANANLSYIIVGGLGQLLDTLFVSATDYAAVNALAVTAGYADLLTAWTAGATAVADMWVKTMKTTTIVFALEFPVPGIVGGLAGLDEFVRARINRYHEQMGVATLKLDGLTAAGGVNSIVRDATRNPKGFQFRFPSSNPACDPSQEPANYDPELGLRNAANAGIDLGAQYEEFYESDILNVTAPYPADFATFQTALKGQAV